jgi:hypothetical protein
MPALVTGAVSPFLGAVMLERFGIDATLAALTAAAVASIVLSLVLLAGIRHRTAASA